MSFDLAVWRPTGQYSAESASRFHDDLCSRPFESFIPGVEMQNFADTVVERYRALRATSDLPWASAPDIGEDCVLMAIRSRLAADVFPIVRELARERRLVCFDPQRSVVYQTASENAEAGNPLTLELPDDRVLYGPTEALIEASVRGLSEVNWFVVLERRKNYYIQAGYGSKAGAPRGKYRIEYRDGSPEKHWRTLSSSLDELVSAFLEYSRGNMELARAFVWMPLGAGG
jgi:hypothetical protein